MILLKRLPFLLFIFIPYQYISALDLNEIESIGEEIRKLEIFLGEENIEDIFISHQRDRIMSEFNRYLENIGNREYHNTKAHKISKFVTEWGIILRDKYQDIPVDSILIDISENMCYCYNTREYIKMNNWGYENRILFKSKIAVGNEAVGRGTIKGKFIIGRKVREPESHWKIRDIKIPYGHIFNSFGARKIELWKDGKYTLYSIHGTNDTTSVGKQISLGCIRFFNRDILILFELILENETVVVIQD